MKVAITCDFLIHKSHYTEVIESLCELYPEARIYTFVHNEGALLGRTEQRMITSTYLSKEVHAEESFYKHSSKIPLLAKNLFVSCEYDVIINLSRGLSHGIKKCDKSKQLTYLYDIGFEGKVKNSFIQKLAYPWFLKYFVDSFKQADSVWISSQSLYDELSYYLPQAEVVLPPFKMNDYALFPKDMYPHDFYLIDTRDLNDEMALPLIDYFIFKNLNFKFMGPDEHLSGLKEKCKDLPKIFLGEKCSGEHAPFLAASKAFISFVSSDFPRYSLGALACGRPIILSTKASLWSRPFDGLYLFEDGQFGSVIAAIETCEKNESVLEPQKLRAHAHPFHEIKFKAHLKKFVENLTH